MDQKRPRGREKNVTGNSTGVHRRGEGLGTGPVGSSNGYSGKSGSSGGYSHSTGGGHSGPNRAALGGGGSLVLILVALFLLYKCGGLSSIFGGNSNAAQETQTQSSGSIFDVLTDGLGGLTGMLGGDSIDLSGGGSAPSSYTADVANYSSSATSYSKVDTSVAAGSRAKRTNIIGNGQDQVTLMVYMCGTDLESKAGMASSDLAEMAAAKYGSNVNVIVYTGGCKKWQTSGISNTNNQIYQVVNGGLKRLVDNDGSKVMTDPNTLSSFIKWAAKNFPANRYELIFWDHGGGSVSGYGYDEKNSRSGAMDLGEINTALKNGGVQFDFIGFDACLMATAETALMLNNHADYMIASEETEPGIGWYYTNWLTQLGNNTSTPTLTLGKTIVDDFVSQCAKKCTGQKTTLSVIDLAEFANTVPSTLTNFSKSLSQQISNNDYKSVSDARYATREFATTNKIDQVDLVDLCKKIGTSQSNALAKAIQGAVKYNRTSSNMTNAYGVSIYFPYKRASYVDTMCETYEDIGMDDDYAKAIRQFAKLEVSGQVASGGSSAASGSLFGSLLGSLAGSSSSAASGNADMIGSLLGSFLGGGSSGLIDGLTGRNIDFMKDSDISVDDAANYIAMNHFDPSNLSWTQYSDGAVLNMPDSQWAYIHSCDLNMFYDDGEGYVDLGLDNIYDWTEDGRLIASNDRTWLAINGQPVAYYHLDTEDDGTNYTITGRVPAYLNKTLVNLILVFDNSHPYGFIAGARTDYKESETLTVAKNLTELKEGDVLEFVCDYYSYSGQYEDSYYLGEPMTVTKNMKISNVDVGNGAVKIAYRFTDIYNQEFWTPSLTF
ncbi:MAG: hypothetical protein J5857_02955 [Treponema sp.]|nr:hypothetical protein [Treponema sp.]